MSGSLHLGKMAGIQLEIHSGWLIILVLLTLSLATGWFPAAAPGASFLTYWSMSLLAALLLFAAVLAHELAHSLVARACGLPVKRITHFIVGRPGHASTGCVVSGYSQSEVTGRCSFAA